MTIYDQFIDKADELIGIYGTTLTLQKVSAGAYDPMTGTVVGSTSDHAVKGVSFPLSDSSVPASNEQSSTGLARKNRRRWIVAGKGLSVTPEAQDKLISGAITYLILSSTPLQPASQAIYYTMIVEEA